jgi:hypothetical protein
MKGLIFMKKTLLFLGFTCAFLAGNLVSPLFHEKVANANPKEFQMVIQPSPFNMFQDPEKPDHPKIIVDKRTKVQYMQSTSGDLTLIVDQTGKPLLYTGKLY